MGFSDQAPKVSRVVLWVEMADGKCQELEYREPHGVEVECDPGSPFRRMPQANVLGTGWDGNSPMSVRFSVNPGLREAGTLRTWSGGGPGVILAAYAKVTGLSYQEVLDRAAGTEPAQAHAVKIAQGTGYVAGEPFPVVIGSGAPPMPEPGIYQISTSESGQLMAIKVADA